jgi:hypothetical protein
MRCFLKYHSQGCFFRGKGPSSCSSSTTSRSSFWGHHSHKSMPHSHPRARPRTHKILAYRWDIDKRACIGTVPAKHAERVRCCGHSSRGVGSIWRILVLTIVPVPRGIFLECKPVSPRDRLLLTKNTLLAREQERSEKEVVFSGSIIHPSSNYIGT